MLLWEVSFQMQRAFFAGNNGFSCFSFYPSLILVPALPTENSIPFLAKIVFVLVEKRVY